MQKNKSFCSNTAFHRPRTRQEESAMEYMITRRLNSTLNDLSAEFSTAYCDRDFRYALSKLKKSDEGNWHENLNRLLRMLKKCGFPYRAREKKDYAFYEKLVLGLIKQGVIPSSKEMSNAIYGSCKKLYESYRAYPSPADYMQRLVDRCCSPEDPWQDDTLRLRILKQFIKYGNYLATGQIGKKKYIQQYVALSLEQDKATDSDVLTHLDDHVFALIVSPSVAEIEAVLRRAAESAPDEFQAQKLCPLLLDPENAALPSAFDAKDYQAAVDLLLQPGSLAQLTGYILCRHASVVYGRDIKEADEARSLLGEKLCSTLSPLIANSISRAVQQAENRSRCVHSFTPILKKNAGGKELVEHLCSQLRKSIHLQINEEDYRLLQISDSLASGLFSKGGATKQNLYLFAIVYGMSYHCPSHTSAPYNAQKDVDKNLFTDYYAANVMQYLSPAALNEKNSMEIIPSGSSINYKNYAEMIYLYAICQDERILPEKQKGKLSENEKQVCLAKEKLKLAARMIDAVKVLTTSDETLETPDLQEGATLRMKAKLRGSDAMIDSEDILALPEEDFLDFIVSNYDRRVYIGKTSRSPFQVNAESHTALAAYTRIVEALHGSTSDDEANSPFEDYLLSITGLKAQARDKDYDKVANRDPHKEFSYGLAFDEVYLPENSQDEIDQDFRQLLLCVNNLLKEWRKDPDKINRTKLLAALYYDFNERHTFDCDEIRGRSFQEHYALFRREINPVLEDCNYALLSGKSLLDVLLAFSSYIYLNA